MLNAGHSTGTLVWIKWLYWVWLCAHSKKRSMQAWISHRPSCRHGGCAFPPTSMPRLCWYWSSGLKNVGCFAALPVSAGGAHQHGVRGAGIGVGPQHIRRELCTFGNQQQLTEQCTAPGRIQPRLTKGPAASLRPSSMVICQRFLLTTLV